MIPLVIVVLLIAFGPTLWVRAVTAYYSREVGGMPGTGGELAQHLVERFELHQVGVECTTPGNDHYDPGSRTVRLSPNHFDGKSLTAVAVAVHEVGHAIQHHRGEALLAWRTRLAPLVAATERLATVAFYVLLLVSAGIRLPHLFVITVAVVILAQLVRVLFHALTLPVEYDASFGKALPIIREGQYVAPKEERAIRRVLHAAALTYVAGALADVLNLWRWIRFLR